MMPGSRSRRIARKTAGGAVAALALVLGGCNTVPVGRVATVPNRPQSVLGKMGRSALFPTTTALDVPKEMSPIDPSNSASGIITPASAVAAEPRAELISSEVPAIVPTARAEPLPPTPLLDEALNRARSRGDVPDPAEPAFIPNLPQPAPALPAVPEAIVNPPVAVEPPAPAPIVADPRPVEAVAPPVPPEELWREGVRKLIGLARSRQEQAGIGNGTGTGASEPPWGLRARVLAWLAEPDIDPDLGPRDADTVRAVLRALQATAAGDARGRGNDVRTAVQTLEARAPLELVDLRLCSSVERFGDFTSYDSPGRRAGELVIIYCEIDGVHHEPTSGGFQTRLAGRLEITPEGGGPSIALPLGTAEETFPRRRRDYYVAYKKRLPANLPPGQYNLRLTLHDVLADRSASRSVPLTIVWAEEPVVSPPHEPAANP